jgi:hypothetical protein
MEDRRCGTCEHWERRGYLFDPDEDAASAARGLKPIRKPLGYCTWNQDWEISDAFPEALSEDLRRVKSDLVTEDYARGCRAWVKREEERG